MELAKKEDNIQVPQDLRFVKTHECHLECASNESFHGTQMFI